MFTLCLYIPTSVPSHAATSNVPPMMHFNHVVDSLKYLGYGIDRLAAEGHLFQDDSPYNWYGSGLIKKPNGEEYLSPLGYDGSSSGIETKNGKPNVQKWINSGGLNCASFVTYFYLNYLPNVVGMNTKSSLGYNTYEYIKTAIENFTLGSDGIHNNGSNKNLPSDWSYQADWTWQQAFDAASETNGITNSRTGKKLSNTNNQYIKKIDAMDYYKELYRINAGRTPTNKVIAQYLNDNTKTYRANYISYMTKDSPFSTEKAKEVTDKNININQLPKLGDILSCGDLIVMGHYNSSNGSTIDMKNGDNICYSHVAIYIGDYNGHSFLAHCTGGAKGFLRSKMIGYTDDGEPEYMGRGVEISTLDDIFSRIPEEGEMKSYPLEFYHIGFPKETGTIKINVKDTNGKALNGAVFNIKHNTLTNLDYNIATDANGFAQINGLPFGTYIIREIQCPNGYKANTLQVTKGSYNSISSNSATVTVSSTNAEIEINATNKPKLTTVYGFICKENSNGTLTQMSGATIGIFKQSDINSYKNNNPNAKYESIYTLDKAYKTCVSGSYQTAPDGNTNKTGLYYFKDIPFGNYIIAEIAAPDNYEKPDEKSIRPIVIDSSKYDSFKSPSNTMKSFYNEKIRMVGANDGFNGNIGAIRNYPKYVTIYGFKAERNKSGNLSQISGATIGLFRKNQVERYLVNNYSYENIFTPSNTDTFIDSCISGSVLTPLGEQKVGSYRFDNITYGEYVIAEIAAPTGYEKPTFDTVRTITVDNAMYDNLNRTVTINGLNQKILQVNENTTKEKKGAIVNTPIIGSITAYIQDTNCATLQGSKFGLFNIYKSGTEEIRTQYPKDFPTSDAYMVSTSDITGKITFENVDLGKYFLVELQASSGYKPLNKIIGQNGNLYVTPTYDNAITINENKKDIDIGVIYNEKNPVVLDGYVVNEKNMPLEGVILSLSIFNPDSGILTPFIDVTTDLNGYFEISNIQTGKYILEEIKTNSGYIKSNNQWLITINENEKTSISLYKGTEQNYIIKNDILPCLKIIKHPNEFIGYNYDNNQNAIKNSIFELKCPDGTKIFKNSSKYGIFKFDKLADGNYELREYKTADGYTKNNSLYYFTVKDGHIYDVKDQNGNICQKTNLVINRRKTSVNIKIENCQNKLSGYIDITGTTDSDNIVVGLYCRQNKKLYSLCETYKFNGTDGYYEFNKILDGKYYLAKVCLTNKKANMEIINNIYVHNGIISIYLA